MRLGMYPQAIAQFEKYEKMKPGLGQTSEFIGRSHLYMGELDKADAKFKEALQRDPRLKPTTLFHLAVLETLRKNPEAASNHIGTLLKEASNSPTAQIFKNALLQAPGAKPPAGAGAKDYKLSDPIKIQLPPTTAADVAGAVAKGVVGGLLGGLFGGGRRQEPEGPSLVAKPALPETTLASKDGKTKINLSGAIEDGKPYIVMGVKESPGNGAPHLIMLQDKNCNVMQPKETSVTSIWEAWGGWKLTVSWTKSYYQDGQLVKQEKGGWSTPWNIFRTQIKDPSEIPGIWKDFGSKPFEGTREVMSSFEPPSQIPFNPADWNLITHATTDAGNKQILTAPFVTGLGTDQNNNLIFKPTDRTACESAPPTAPLLAGPTTFPWNVGPYGITVTSDPKSTLAVRHIHTSIPRVLADVGQPPPVFPEKTKSPVRPKGDKVETKPEGTTTAHAPRIMIEARPGGAEIVTYPDGRTRERRPDGTRAETRPDGTSVETFPYRSSSSSFPGDVTRIETYPDGRTIAHRLDGITIETRPDATRIVTRPDGTRTETRPDGSSAETRPDGTRTETRPDGSRTAVFPDGSRVDVGTDGSITLQDPPQTGQPPPEPTDSQPPPSILDLIDENSHFIAGVRRALSGRAPLLMSLSPLDPHGGLRLLAQKALADFDEALRGVGDEKACCD